MIRLHSEHHRVHRYIGWGIALVLVVLPVGRLFVTEGTMELAFDRPGIAVWVGLAIYLFLIFACISAGFWWVNVRIELRARRVARERRWGPFLTRESETLDAFDRVVLGFESEDLVIQLAGPVKTWTIAWGRRRGRAAPIARRIADQLQLPLVGDEPEEEW